MTKVKNTETQPIIVDFRSMQGLRSHRERSFTSTDKIKKSTRTTSTFGTGGSFIFLVFGVGGAPPPPLPAAAAPVVEDEVPPVAEDWDDEGPGSSSSSG